MIISWISKVIILITAFTVGHTSTLVLATFNIISINTDLVEFLIPLTIFITALFNVIYNNESFNRNLHLIKYVAAMAFGFIHGLGFSNYLKSLLGSEKSIIASLFAFNLGIELGQVMIVLIIMLITWLTVTILKTKRREWNLILAGAAMGISLILMMERFPF